MSHKSRAIFFALIQHSTKNFRLPNFLSIILELCSHLQIFSLVILSLIYRSTENDSDTFSWGVHKVLSYLAPFNIFNPFTLEKNAIIIVSLCGLYFASFLGIILYVFSQVSLGKNPKNFLTNLLSILALLHSKVVFYLIHCFLVRVLDLSASLDSSFFDKRVPWIIVSVLLMVVNMAPAILQELFCFQIHDNNDMLSIKDNFHGWNMLAHKSLVIMLFYFIEDPIVVVVVFNLLFTVANLMTLHRKLSYYNITMLKMNIAMATISAWCSGISIGKIIEKDENLFMIISLTIGLVVKISLIKLNWTLKGILSLQNKMTCYHVVHLPSLLREYRKKLAIYPTPEQSNKETLYSVGFAVASDPMDRIYKMSKEEAVQFYISDEIDKQAFSIITKEMLNLLNKHRGDHKIKELVTLALAQIYTQNFGDAFRAMLILSKLDTKNMSVPGSNSMKALSLKLESANHTLLENDSNSSHMAYFAYKIKTQSLKERIKQEIEEQVKFWKSLNANIIDAMPVITQGSLISSLTRKISQYWQSNFEGSEQIYTNAAIMYGLYLEIVQAFPAGGSTMIRKAFQSLHNKIHPLKEVLDILMGDSAIVVASVEPDKIGKIVDASSSVEEVFKIKKQALIGTNVGVIMPSVIAAKHNDFIKSYYHRSKHNINRMIKSYAKTMTDEYFAADISLSLSPFTLSGLSIVACIKKTSEYEPIIILDYDGNIVEYSKDLASMLDLFVKKTYVKIESLSTELKIANKAFNIIYTPQENSRDEEESVSKEQLLQDEILLHNDKTPRSPKSASNDGDLLISPTSKALLWSSADDNNLALKSTERFKKILCNDDTELPSPLTPFTPATPAEADETRGELISLTREEAEKICEIYKNGREVRITALNSRLRHSLSAGTNEFNCHVEIEPLIFKGKFFKILKLKDGLSPQQKRVPATSIQVASTTFNPDKNTPYDDEFADKFPIEVEREPSTNENLKFSMSNFHSEAVAKPKNLHVQVHKDSTTQLLSRQVEESQDNRKRFAISEPLPSKKSKKGKTQSIITSQHTNRSQARQLNNSLKIEKQSPSIKIVINLIYLAIIIIIASIVIDLVFANQSLQNMADSMDLIGTVNSRLAKTIVAWQAILILYTRCVGLRPLDYRVPKYQAVIIETSTEMLENGQELMQKVDAFGDEGIVKTFYEKSISFYEPEDKSLFDNQKINSFVGHSVITDYNLYFGRYPGPLTDLAGSRRTLFAINNTANDFMIALDYAVSEISDFFDETKSSNIRLLNAIVGLESFFVVIPCGLIAVILAMTVKLYSQLFQAMCKVHNSSLIWRIKHLENILALFNENIEDDFTGFYNFKWQESVKQKTLENTEKAHIYSSRKYSGQSLVVYGLRYILLAFILTAVILTLITTSLHRSVSNFDALDAINDRIITVYDISSKVKMVMSTYFFTATFYNYTDYKIRNQDPVQELEKYLDAMGNANSILLNALTDDNNVIDDPVVKDILTGKVCKYCDEDYYSTCLNQTNGESFGLLGLQPKLYDVFKITREWVTTDNRTQELAVSLIVEIGNTLLDLHFVVYSIHDYLADHLIKVFLETTREKKDQVLRTFYINMVVTLIALTLIRVIVLDKLRLLDIGIRRILRIIPYKIIEDNKVMAHYLNRVFNNELKILKQFS